MNRRAMPLLAAMIMVGGMPSARLPPSREPKPSGPSDEDQRRIAAAEAKRERRRQRNLRVERGRVVRGHLREIVAITRQRDASSVPVPIVFPNDNPEAFAEEVRKAAAEIGRLP